ncbi:MAG: nucleotide exchange factor GrpE [Cyanobacteria bacterium SZAS TMP-1]|nr:nucleotide exchange factor GrpE [Cyanobacteria bacterium SZAS TMP-1]
MASDDNDKPKTDEPAGESREDRNSRMNNAKAFYRAMYAGAEPDPEEFGIDMGTPKASANDAASQAAVLHLEGQLKDMEAKAAEWENLYKRMQADFDNYRKRMDRERDEMQSAGMQKALEAILPALDDLDMAQSKLTEQTEAKVMLQSFKMICARFTRCLEQIGIKQMQVIGEPFDPRLHEPIQEVHTAEYPEGAVVQQLRPGYMFGEKVLRPTLVNVATAPLDGPGYQAPAEVAEAAVAPAEEAVAVESAPAPEAAAPDNGRADKIEVSEEDIIAAGREVEALQQAHVVHGSPSESETSDVLTPVDDSDRLSSEEAVTSSEEA